MINPADLFNGQPMVDIGGVMVAVCARCGALVPTAPLETPYYKDPMFIHAQWHMEMA